MVPGINAPPMHPWCRSTTVPHLGNWRINSFNERKDKYQIKDYLSESGALSNKMINTVLKEESTHKRIIIQ